PWPQESTPDESLLQGKRRQDLQEMLREVGLEVEYWLPKLQEHLEKRALEKLLNLSHSNSISELQDTQENMIKKNQKQTEQALQELRDLLSEGRQ
ncbi:hypothetical protein HPG69_005846, partial [Diceros bicornis minor]